MIIYWDIDGTIIDTQSSGDCAINLLKENYNISTNYSYKTTKLGVTDKFNLFQWYILFFKQVPTTQSLNIFMSKYEDFLIKNLRNRYNILLGQLYPIFQYKDFTHRIFTGNRECLARRKLELCQLTPYIDWEHSIFGVNTFTKYEALKSKSKHIDLFNGIPTVWISDSVNDLSNIKFQDGYRVGVLTGKSTYKEFITIGVDYIWDVIPCLETFKKFFEI